MISMEKKYKTRDGQNVRLLCVDGPQPFPVIAIASTIVICCTLNGNSSLSGEEHYYDLIEVSPYGGFKKDDPVMVRDCDTQVWFRRHFSHVNEDGDPCTFENGATSWSVNFTVAWKECRRPTAEELEGVK